MGRRRRARRSPGARRPGPHRGAAGQAQLHGGGGGCAGAPGFALYVDTNGDGNADTNRSYTCSAGGGGATKSFDPVTGATGAPALPAGAVATALDVVLGAAGAVALDDISVAGITVGDLRTFTPAGPLPG